MTVTLKPMMEIPAMPEVPVLGGMPVMPTPPRPPIAAPSGASTYVSPPIPPGTTLGMVPGLEGLLPESAFHAKYEILNTVSNSGGQAVVMRVRTRDPEPREFVARRARLVGDVDAQGRIIRDARATARLDHPGIVKAIECFDASEVVENADGVRVVIEPRFWMVQEKIPGTNLTTHLSADRRLAVADVVTIRDQLVATLEYAHSHGVIHRDVKPSNVMIFRDATGDLRVKLIDFGIAKIAGDQTGTASHASFSWNYAAPEQIGGVPGAKVSAATDWYSLGFTLLSLLEGRPNDNLVVFDNPLPRATALRKQTKDPVAKALLKDIEAMLQWKPVRRRVVQRKAVSREEKEAAALRESWAALRAGKYDRRQRIVAAFMWSGIALAMAWQGWRLYDGWGESAETATTVVTTDTSKTNTPTAKPAIEFASIGYLTTEFLQLMKEKDYDGASARYRQVMRVYLRCADGLDRCTNETRQQINEWLRTASQIMTRAGHAPSTFESPL